MRKRILIIVAIVLVLGGAFFLLEKYRPNSTNTGGTIVERALNLFPFGKNETTQQADNQETPVITTDTQEEPSAIDTTLPRLRRLSTRGVAGATTIVKKREVIPAPAETPATVDGTQTAVVPEPAEETVPPQLEDVRYVRYIEKSTGNIYDIAIDEAAATRITNTTIPRITEALFTTGGQSVIIRYLENDNKTISTWDGSIIAGRVDEPSRLGGNFLEDNITTLSVSPDGKNIFYMRDIGDVTYGYTALANGTGIKQIFDSSFSEWISGWTRPTEITLTAKASGYFEGYSYALSPDGNTFKKILGPVFGLTRQADVLGTYSLFSYTQARGTQMQVLDETTGKQLEIPINTLPEKCVWSKTRPAVYCAVPHSLESRIYPDDWYQGVYFNSDSIWMYDLNNGVGVFISNPSAEAKEDIDAISLGLTDDESMLYFINKRDNILWGIAL